MKIRNSFVTNSSSSSFILGFKDEDSIEDTLACDKTYDYFDRIYEDCSNEKKMNLEEMIEVYKEEMESWIYYGLIHKYEKENGYLSWEERQKIVETKEFKDACENELNQRIETLKEDAKDMSVFIQVEYSDNIGENELEHEIVPRLKCCLRRFSHH